MTVGAVKLRGVPPCLPAPLQLGLFGDKKFTSYEEVLRFFSSQVGLGRGASDPAPRACLQEPLPAAACPATCRAATPQAAACLLTHPPAALKGRLLTG